SVNFAATIGAADKKVLLIDSDFRKGYINQYFSLKRENGFSELIAGTINIESAIHMNVMPNVDFLSTGILPPNPAELLLSPTTLKVLKELSKNYDLVVIDTAALLAL